MIRRKCILRVLTISFLFGFAPPFSFAFEHTAEQCGTFQFTDPTSTTNGTVTVAFKFDPLPTCRIQCQCNNIAYIQIVRVFNPQRTQFYHVDDEQLSRMVRDSEYWLNGWAVDRQPGRKSGYYGYIDGDGKEMPSLGIQPGDNINPAVLTDKPNGFPEGAKGEVISFAVCRDTNGNCPDCILGNYFWAFTLESEDRLTITADYEGQEWHRDALYHSILNWNREAERLKKYKLPDVRHLTHLEH